MATATGTGTAAGGGDGEGKEASGRIRVADRARGGSEPPARRQPPRSSPDRVEAVRGSMTFNA